MKIFRLFAVVSLLAAMAACGGDDDDTPVMLAAPQPVQDMEATTPYKVVIVWEQVDNARAYNCVLDDSAPFYTESCTVSYGALSASSTHTFRVMALTGDAERFVNSEWSETITVETAAAE